MSRARRDGPGRIVLNLGDRRPIWSAPEWAFEELGAALPKGWEMQVVRALTDGAGDGGRAPNRQVLRAVQGARVYIGFGVPEPILEAGTPTLEWVHSCAAGVGGSLHKTMRGSPVKFTNSAGVHASPMAESVVGMLLYFARGFDFAVEGHRWRRWNEAPFLDLDTPVRELASMTVGIVGYGGIGREVGRRLKALGCRVIGVRRSEPEAAVDPMGVEMVHGDSGLETALAESDAIVIGAPETAQTRGLFTLARLRSMKAGAVLVNVARGKIVDEDALIEVLKEGHLRGAALDVFAVEPLPDGHPLWTAPNVLILPHVSAVTREFWRREMDLILENFRRFLDGRPLLNEVDRELGY
jgi:phosphoglycerate dehydrogenase-like enzyme